MRKQDNDLYNVHINYLYDNPAECNAFQLMYGISASRCIKGTTDTQIHERQSNMFFL